MRGSLPLDRFAARPMCASDTCGKATGIDLAGNIAMMTTVNVHPSRNTGQQAGTHVVGLTNYVDYFPPMPLAQDKASQRLHCMMALSNGTGHCPKLDSACFPPPPVRTQGRPAWSLGACGGTTGTQHCGWALEGTSHQTLDSRAHACASTGHHAVVAGVRRRCARRRHLRHVATPVQQ